MLTKSFMINGQTCEGHGHTDKHYIGIFAWNAFTLFLPLKWSLFNSNNSKKCYELEINKETCLSWRQWHQNTKVMAKGFTPFTTYKTILRSRTEDQITSKKFWHCKRVINLASAWVSNGLPKVKHFLQSIRNYIYSRYFVKHFIEALQWHLWLKATCYIQIHGYGSIALVFCGKTPTCNRWPLEQANVPPNTAYTSTQVQTLIKSEESDWFRTCLQTFFQTSKQKPKLISVLLTCPWEDKRKPQQKLLGSTTLWDYSFLVLTWRATGWLAPL